jgi:hypothetical protein
MTSLERSRYLIVSHEWLRAYDAPAASHSSRPDAPPRIA